MLLIIKNKTEKGGEMRNNIPLVNELLRLANGYHLNREDKNTLALLNAALVINPKNAFVLACRR